MAFFFSVKEEFVSNETVFAVASVGEKDTQNQCVGAKKTTTFNLELHEFDT